MGRGELRRGYLVRITTKIPMHGAPPTDDGSASPDHLVWSKSLRAEL
jgi:hypothetical protein